MTNEHRPPEHGLALKEISLKELACRGAIKAFREPTPNARRTGRAEEQAGTA